MAHEILEHTADVGFRATGETLAEAFESATRAFAEIVSYENPPEPTDEIEIDVEAENLEALLFDYLARLIYVQDVEGVVIADADVTATEEPPRVEATLHVAPSRRGFMDIKAPTYSDMRAEHDDDGWILEAILDI